MFAPPQLANTDGDPMVPQKLYFNIDSPDRAFHHFKTLAEGWNETELLESATIKDGLIVEAEIPWLGGSEEARKRLGGPVLLGLLKIDGNRLVVEVNSKQRAQTIQRLVEERLGNTAMYKTTLIEPIESRVQETWKASAAGVTHSQSRNTLDVTDSDFISFDDAQPELQAMMAQINKQHWESWFDLPVPALNDMTPRDAAKTEEGRELLESLLLLYENYQHNPSDNITNPDIPALRRELGME
jgi:hypothetical protein